MSNKQDDIQKDIYKGQLKGSKFIEGTGSSIENIAQVYKEYKENLLKADETNIENPIATSTDGVDEDLKKDFENKETFVDIVENENLNYEMDSSNLIKTQNVLKQDIEEKDNFIKTSVNDFLKEGAGGTSSTSPLQLIKTSTSNDDYDEMLYEEDEYDFDENYIFENEIEEPSQSQEEKFFEDSKKLKTKADKTKMEKVGSAIKKVGKATESITRTQRRVSAIQTSVDRNDGGKEVYKTAGKEYVKRKVKKSKPVVAVKRKSANIVKNIFTGIIKLVMDFLKKMAMIAVGSIPVLLPVVICFALIVGVMSAFGFLSDEDENIFGKYEDYIIETTNEYNEQISDFESENEYNIVNGISNIDWQTPLAIIQQLGGTTEYDDAEKYLLGEFKNNDLYEKHTKEKKKIEVTVEYEEEVEKDGKKETVTKTKKEEKQVEVLTIKNSTYTDYINFLEDNPNVLKTFRTKKGLGSNDYQITDTDKQNIEYLAKSSNFYALASEELKNAITYNGNGVVVKGDSEVGNKIAELALSRQGYMYLWGGCHSMSEIKDPNHTRFDCSGLVSWAYYQAGADIGSNTCSTLLKKGRTITYEQLQAGDIILYSNPSEGVHHVGIYIGGDKIVHAPRTGKPVQTVNARWSSETMIYKRLLDY